MEETKPMTVLLTIIRIINENENFVTMSQIMENVEETSWSKTTFYSTRNQLTQAGYLESTHCFGTYRILSKIPEDLTNNQLFLRAYPDNPKSNIKYLRPEWRNWYYKRVYKL